MTAAQMRIADTIDAFYGEAGTGDGVSRSYKQAVEDLDSETIKALDGPYRYFFFFSSGTTNGTFADKEQKKKKKGLPFSIPSRISVPTSPTSTSASKSGATR